MKKNIAKIALMALLIAPFGLALPALAAAPNWNTSGNYVVNFNYLGPNYAHDMTLAQDGLGNLTGSGGNPAGGPYVYTWALTSGSVSGNSIDFLANYTAPASATTPLTTMHVMGIVAPDGSMSGTWSDNYQGGSRSGTWMTTSGNAVAINVVTNPATSITSSNATLNGTNGGSAATGHSLWVSLTPFVTTSSTIPAGVYSTPDMGAIAANTPFSASLSSLTTTGVPGNLPAITPNTTYYFAAWSNVGGTWFPGAVLNFTTAKTTIGGHRGHGEDNEGIENGHDNEGLENENDNKNVETPGNHGNNNQGNNGGHGNNNQGKDH